MGQRSISPADKLNMSQRPQSWRERATLVADEISLGCALLDRADAERELGDTSAACTSVADSQASCDSARQCLGELSCLMQSHREILERSILRLQSAISEFRLADGDMVPEQAEVLLFAENRRR